MDFSTPLAARVRKYRHQWTTGLRQTLDRCGSSGRYSVLGRREICPRVAPSDPEARVMEQMSIVGSRLDGGEVAVILVFTSWTERKAPPAFLG